MDQSLPADATVSGPQTVHAALVCNPRAGSLSRMSDPVAALRGAIQAAGFHVVGPADAGNDIDAQWAAAVDAGAQVVFAAGGDGTLRSVAALALRDDMTLGLVPGGTMNRVCARLGVTGDPVQAIARYSPGHERRLDVCFANREVFLFESLLGAPARLLRFREMQRGGGLLGWLPLLLMAWRKLRAFDLGRIRLSLADGTRLRGTAAVITLPEPEQASLLSVSVTQQVAPLQRLGQALAWFRRRLASRDDTNVEHSRRLVVVSSRRLMRLSLDGEMHLMPPPIRFRIAPGALRILAPRG